MILPPKNQLELEAGTILAGRYEIREKLGQGGFGAVYLAFDQGPLKRQVALKILRIAAPEAPRDTASHLQRFIQEARLAGQLSHANIAIVFDIGETDGQLYMTQELAPGADLQRLLSREERPSLRRVLAIIRQVCSGLAHAHAHGIIHRDIKPGNVIVDDSDHVKITDFGIAQAAGEDSGAGGALPAGTPGYMPPEQLRGEKVDARADIFAVGCVLYQLLTGRPPFEGDNLKSVVDKTMNMVPPEPSRVREDLPRALDRIVSRAMRKNPAERYQGIDLLVQDLANYEQFESLLGAGQGASAIAGAVEKRECVLFVGLQLPARDGSPGAATGEQFVIEYLSGQLSVPTRSRGLPEVAQALEMECGRAGMLKHLASVSRSPAVSPREIVRRIARLPFPLIVTTRYDSFLEDELARRERRVRKIGALGGVPDNLAEEDSLIHLFGEADDESSVIITEEDLWSFLGSFHSIPDSLRSLLATRTILFIGYDPDDPHFRHLYLEIARLRGGGSGTAFLSAADLALPGISWADRRGLGLVDCDPAELLTLLEEEMVDRRRAAERQPGAAAPPIPGRPYKFLNYFEEEDRGIFFGRDTEIRRLLSKVLAYPLSVLHAPSGSGKTSLIHAGLMPALRGQGFVPVYCRLFDDPVGEIRRAVRESAGIPATTAPGPQPDGAGSGADLPGLLRDASRRHGRPIVILLDQFEELFVRYDRAMRDQFAGALKACLESAGADVRFLLSLREDYLARLAEFRERIPTIFHNEFRLDRLTEEAARAAIIEPARLVGVEVEPVLADRLIADLSSEGIEPPQLQIICDTLYDARPFGDERMTLRLYEKQGGTRGILAGYLERTLRELSPEDRRPAREVLKGLLTSEETKSVCTMRDLARTAGISGEQVSRIVQELSERRLLRKVVREDGAWYELTHEYLAEEIARWLSDTEKTLKKIRELLDQALRNHRHLGMLMPAQQVRLVREHEADLRLTREEHQLLRASEGAQARRRRNLAAAAVCVAILGLVAGVTGRSLYLRSSMFIEPLDREMVEESYGRLQSHRIETIRILRGSPERLWIDRQLGFPRFEYETDIDMNQVHPTNRDAIKRGRMLNRDRSALDELFELLKPEEQVKHLFLLGRVDEALDLFAVLAPTHQVVNPDFLYLISLLAACGITDDRFIEPALRYVMNVKFGYYHDSRLGSDQRPVSLALVSLDPGAVAGRLAPFLGSPETGRTGREILAHTGSPADSSLLLPLLDNDDSNDDSDVIRTLDAIGDVSARARMISLLNHPDPLGYVNSAAARYLMRRPHPDDFEALSSAIAPPGAGATLHRSVADLLAQRGGEKSLPYLRAGLEGQYELDSRWDRFYPVSFAAGIRDARAVEYACSLLDDHRAEVRIRAAYGLARLGIPDALDVAVSAVADSSGESVLLDWALEVFRWIGGPQVRAMLLQLNAEEEVSEHIVRPESGWGHGNRTRAARALWMYDDDEVIKALLGMLYDRDNDVRAAARSSLVLNGSERVRSRLAGMVEAGTPLIRLRAASVLQGLGAISSAEPFREFLEETADTTRDCHDVRLGVRCLRSAFLSGDVVDALAGLRHPKRTIRLAATLALIEHEDRRSVEDSLEALAEAQDPNMQMAARRGLMALQIYRRGEALRDSCDAALARDDNLWADIVLARAGLFVHGQVGFTPALSYEWLTGSAINIRPRAEWISTRDAILRLRRVDSSIRPADFLLQNLGWNLATRPDLWRPMLELPEFDVVRDRYDFRVSAGLERPIMMEGIGFSDGAADN